MKTKSPPSKRVIKDIVTLCKRNFCKWLLEKLYVSDTVPTMKKTSKKMMKKDSSSKKHERGESKAQKMREVRRGGKS